MIKGNLSANLLQVGNILQKEKICLDITPINLAISELKKGVCNLQKLKLRINDVPNNTHPSVKSLEVLLTVQIAENKLGENDIYEVVNNYNFLIVISGKNGEQTVQSSLHLDFDKGSGSEYIHPSFHFTYGGKEMKSMKLGDVLLLPAPRITHPPMDAVLGIDFILSNFLKKDLYDKIRSNSQYKAALKHSQQRLWRPYMLSLASHWCNFKNCLQYNSDNSLRNQYYPTLVD